MRALLDTCTLSEVRKTEGIPAVKECVSQFRDDDLFISAISMGEIVKGISLLESGKKKKSLTSWLRQLETAFGDRILPVDLETAHIWGELTARAQSKGIVIPDSDGLVAATGLRHGLHVITRNARHFEATGALTIDPWENR